MLELRSTRTISALALCAALFGGADSASAIQLETLRTTPHPTGLCFRDPDITADADHYYVTYFEGRCDGTGVQTVRLAKISAATFSPVLQTTVHTTTATSEPSQWPITRVSASGGLVHVAVVDRTSTPNRIFFRIVTTDLDVGVPRSPINTGGPVADLSLDCDQSDPMSPCVISDLENLGFGLRAVVRDGFSTTANVGPPSLIAGEFANGIASVGGALPNRGAALSTNVVVRAQVFHAAPLPASMFTNLDMSGSNTNQLIPGIAALRFKGSSGGVAAVWSNRSQILFASGSTWNPVAVRRFMVLSGPPTFAVDDAAQVGRSVLVVGRGTSATGSLDGAPFAWTEIIPTMSAAALPIVGSTVMQMSRTRIASPTSCAEASRAAAVFVTGSPSSGPTTLNFAPFGCASHDDCIDPTGVGGTCSGGRCSFATGPCSRDSGVDSGVDASRDTGVDTGVDAPSDANFVPRDSGIDTGNQDATPSDAQVPPADQGVSDATVNNDASNNDAAGDAAASDASSGSDAMDGASMDSSGNGDGSAQPGDGGAKPPSINGGACQCRAPSAPANTSSRALAALLAIGALTVCARRRARALR